MAAIYLLNLTHIRDGRPSQEAIPLNLGYLAAYLKQYLPEECVIRIFNHPDKFEQALKKKMPDILGASNYIWNSRLNYFYLSLAKKQKPDLVTVMGGPHFPKSKNRQEEFLRHHGQVDFYVYREGEIAFLELVQRLLAAGLDVDKIKQGPLEGCCFMSEERFVGPGEPKRVDSLDSIPSPYLTGLLDEFLFDGFVPILQTNRGCPFSCAYCVCSDQYYNKIYEFDLSRVLAEVDYIAPRVKSRSLHVTDSNFGIFERDCRIAQKLRETKETNGWPLMVNAATAKSNKERVARCIGKLGKSIYFSASVQSFNEATLKEIKRENLPFERYKSIMDELREEETMFSNCELIIPMPRESKETHLAGIKKAIEAGMDFVNPYTLMLLENTPLKEDAYYDRFQMLKRYRVIPRNFGVYQGSKIVESETVCVSTDTISWEDYLYLRGFHFVLSSFYNFQAIKELVRYLKEIGIPLFDWLTDIYETIRIDKGRAGEIYQCFCREAKTEAWEDEGQLLSCYDDDVHFQKLLAGEQGDNLLLKYHAICLDNLPSFVDLALRVTVRRCPHQADRRILDDLGRYCVSRRGNIFDTSKEDEVCEEFSFDILSWEKNGFRKGIKQFLGTTTIVFKMTDELKQIIADYVRLYGNDASGRGRILARIPLSLLSRGCEYNSIVKTIIPSGKENAG